MRLSSYRLFAGQTVSTEEAELLKALGAKLLEMATNETLAIYFAEPLFSKLVGLNPELLKRVKYVIQEGRETSELVDGVQWIGPDQVPDQVTSIFLCEIQTYPQCRNTKSLKSSAKIHTPDIVLEIPGVKIPDHAWIAQVDSIYPVDIPEIEFEPGLDMILLDCPARNLALMPNGVGYVHNTLKTTGINFQTVDLDIITYHRFHTHRLLDLGDQPIYSGNHKLPDDPWLAENYEEWQNVEGTKYFLPILEETFAKLMVANPKILGLSLQACNLFFTKELARRVKAERPEMIIVVGGFSCYQSEIGLNAFPLADYMCIGESDLTLGPLVKKVLAGERPGNLPGIFSKFDERGKLFQPAPQPHNLDELEIPKYDWYPLNIYRNFNHYQLTPIIATRGCRWSRCTFCAERFAWRARSPKNVVDEFEWLADNGCELFMFNESDLNGRPELLLEICDEIIRRRLFINLTGQLRIHRQADRAFFDKLTEAGFSALRFGVDAWSPNTLRGQMKGYTVDMIRQNLRDCSQAGIYTEVNTVIGVPGETEEDIDRTIELKVECKPWIGRLANMNPLMLMVGSVYWQKPDEFNIHFRGNKEELFTKHPLYMPEEYWYSEGPYIDGAVRKDRFQRVVRALRDSGFEMGAFVSQVIDDVDAGKGANLSARPGVEEMHSGIKDENAEEAMPIPELRFPEAQGKKPGKMKTEMRISSMVDPSVYKVPAANYKVIRYLDQYYGVTPSDHEWLVKEYGPNLDGWMGNANATGPATSWMAKKARELKTSDAGHSMFRQSTADLAAKVLGRVAGSPIERAVIFSENDYGYATQLKKEGFFGYNVIKVQQKYYAVKQGFPFSKDRMDRNGYPAGACLVAGRYRDIMDAVLDYVTKNPDHASEIKVGFNGYNLFTRGPKFYALKAGLKFNAHKVTQGLYKYGELFQGESAKELEEKVLDHVNGVAAPELVEDGYRGYQILRSGAVFYAVKNGIVFDKIKFTSGQYTEDEVIRCSSIKTLKLMIGDRPEDAPGEKHVIRPDYYGYEIFKIGTGVYALRHGVTFNKVKADNIQYPIGECFTARWTKEAEEMVTNYLSQKEAIASMA